MSQSPRSHDNSAISPVRELAFLALCHLDKVAADQRVASLELFWNVGHGAGEGAAGAIAGLASDERTKQGAQATLSDFLEHASEVDAIIEKTSERWRLARMDVTDRNCMRLATLELLRTKPSKRAIVADAVRLASRYGSERSARFVNGVVEAIAKVLRGADDSAESS
jgi:N utilization substance protein B